MSNRTAIVVEGGAMRGVFSAGVLDVFLERRFHPFDLAIGVSAGACNLASHLAGQHGRNRRCYFELMTRREFIDPLRFARARGMVDLDWLWDTLAEREPLDVAAVVAQKTEFVVVATSAEAGHPTYLRPGMDDMFDALKGSCALPLLSRGAVRVGAASVVDGGVSDPIPAEQAYRLGAREILVIRSRTADYVKKESWSTPLIAMLLRRTPGIAAALRLTAQRYQQAVHFLHHPPSDCRIVQVAPPEPLLTKRTTQRAAALEHDYQLGRRIGGATVDGWAIESLGGRRPPAGMAPDDAGTAEKLHDPSL